MAVLESAHASNSVYSKYTIFVNTAHKAFKSAFCDADVEIDGNTK